MNWKQAAVVAGVSAAAGLVLYYLLKDEENESESSQKPNLVGKISDTQKTSKKVNVNDITKDEVLLILRDIIRSQDKMKIIMKDLTKEIIKNNYNFEKTYVRVKDIQPDDPLEEHGVSMNDFDTLLDKYQYDPSVHELISRIMGTPSPMSTMTRTAREITKSTIVEVHEYMLEELKTLVQQFNKMPNRHAFDMKTVTIAAQALVGAKVEEKYKLNSEDIECAVLMHHHTLASDPQFGQINVQMQATMSQLMGAQFPLFQ